MEAWSLALKNDGKNVLEAVIHQLFMPIRIQYILRIIMIMLSTVPLIMGVGVVSKISTNQTPLKKSCLCP